jgi:hypothetical protein
VEKQFEGIAKITPLVEVKVLEELTVAII